MKELKAMGFVASGLFATCFAINGLAAPEIVVKTAKPEVVTESDGYVNVGRVAGSHQVQLSARVVGTLWEKNGEEGAHVKKGDVLYRIEDTIYKANLQTAKAELAELEIQLKQAEIDAQRYSAGEAKGGVSKSDRDRTILSRDVAKAKIEAAKAKVALCENDLSYCTITSPIEGVLGRNKFDVGNNVSPNSGDLRDVIATDPIDVLVAIPERQVIWAFEQRKLSKAAHIRIQRADGKDCPVELKVYAVDNKVDSSTGTLLVRFRGDNKEGLLQPGGYVKMILSRIFKEPRLAVPMSAVLFDGDKRFLFVVENGKAKKRELKVGESIGNRIFVTDGLKAEESFISTGIHKLFDGAAVKEI